MSADATRLRMLAFTSALNDEAKRFRAAFDRLEDLVDDNDEARAQLRELRLALEFPGCLRRLVSSSTPDQIHKAFGAPGDFGYETPFGDALARFYGVIS